MCVSSTKISDDLFELLTVNFDFPPIFAKTLYFLPISGNLLFSTYFFEIFPPDFVKCTCFCMLSVLFLPPSLTMMHLCITQCTYSMSLRTALSRHAIGGSCAVDLKFCVVHIFCRITL